MPRRFLAAVLILAASAAAAQTPAQSAAQIQAQIDTLSRQLAAYAADQSRGGDALGEGRSKLAALNASEADLMARMGANQNQLSRLLGALQMYGRNPPPALLVHPDDAKKAVRAAILIRAMAPELQARAKGYADQAEVATRARREAAAASETLFTTESAIADRASRIEELIAERQALQQRLGAPARADVVAIAARIQSLRADPSAATGPARAGASPARLIAPVPGAPQRRFGEAAPAGGQVAGWTWTPPSGSQVVSPAAGRVEYAGPLRGSDNVVIVDIGGGYHLVLAGVHSLTVSAGQNLNAGQPVAKMAVDPLQNAFSTAAQLYMEVRKGGEPVDPARFFAAIAQ